MVEQNLSRHGKILVERETKNGVCVESYVCPYATDMLQTSLKQCGTMSRINGWSQRRTEDG